MNVVLHFWFFFSGRNFTYFLDCFQKQWVLQPDDYYHFTVEEKADDNIPSIELTSQAIEYAKELEMIV